MDRFFTRAAAAIAVWMGRPIAFVAAVLGIVAWAFTGPLFGFSDTWQLVVNTATTIITFLMVFLIQNSQNRDGAAIQAKLDEIIRSIGDARNQFIGIEHLTERELAAVRDKIETEAAGVVEAIAADTGEAVAAAASDAIAAAGRATGAAAQPGSRHAG